VGFAQDEEHPGVNRSKPHTDHRAHRPPRLPPTGLHVAGLASGGPELFQARRGGALALKVTSRSDG